MLSVLHKLGIRSHLLYTAGIGSVAASMIAWAASQKLEDADRARADRWGIFVGQWAPTFFALGVAMRLEEEA